MPIVVKGSELSKGVVVAICHNHVKIATPGGVKQFTFKEVENLVGLV